MSSNDRLPQMDMSYVAGNGYTAIAELMRAMILRTVEDYNSGGELREDAITYMFEEEEEYVLSFRYICRHMGMDPDKARYRIMNAKERISTRRRAA